MAGKLPGFITGANAKIKIGAQTMAYATDVSYNIDTMTVPVEVMGRYEVLSNEPIAYGCNGSFSVVRYTKQAKIAGIDDPADNGNSPANITGMAAHLDPGKMISSSTFDMEIFQKFNATSAGVVTSGDVVGFFKLKDCRVVRRGATLNKRGVLVDTYQFVGIIAEDTDTGTVGTSGEQDLST